MGINKSILKQAVPSIIANITVPLVGMADVAIALLPAGVFGVWNFGWRALLVIAVCVLSCMLSEFVYEKLLKHPVTIGDCSALVTGLLLAYNLPVGIPIWIAVLGSVFAIIAVKQLFGGIGQNFINPALAARCFLLSLLSL